MSSNSKDMNKLAHEFMLRCNIYTHESFTEADLIWMFASFFAAIDRGVSRLQSQNEYKGIRTTHLCDAIQVTDFNNSILIASSYVSPTIGAICRQPFHVNIGRSRERIRLRVDDQILFISYMDTALESILLRFPSLTIADLPFLLDRQRINKMIDYYGRQL